MCLWNAGLLQRDCAALYARRLSSSTLTKSGFIVNLSYFGERSRVVILYVYSSVQSV
jgi:hypothetical protein